jgi:hypothetical protein
MEILLEAMYNFFMFDFPLKNIAFADPRSAGISLQRIANHYAGFDSIAHGLLIALSTTADPGQL